jgi:5-methylcytosine-specific restriction enzyme A
VPWLGIFDRLITESAQNGYYLVYLVREDCSGVYLAIGQGVTVVRTHYGADTSTALQTRAADFRAKLGDLPNGVGYGPVELADGRSTQLVRDYAV